ncbi:MAG: hypothetical protein ACON35_00165 [Candidatus Marinamargulisbacteria bacterium]
MSLLRLSRCPMPIRKKIYESFQPVAWQRAVTATPSPFVSINRSQIQYSKIMGSDPIELPPNVRQWVGAEVEQSGVTGLKQLSCYLLQHDGLSPAPVVENVHEDGVPLTMLMPLTLTNVHYRFKLVGENHQSQTLALSEGDCVAFNGLHGVKRSPGQSTLPMFSIICAIFFHDRTI